MRFWILEWCDLAILRLCNGVKLILWSILPAFIVLALFWGQVVQAEKNAGIFSTLNRSEEPVVLPATLLPNFLGQPIANLRLYALQAGVWQAVPFQIDEQDITGTYTIEDGILDGNDELVFMAKDAGNQANVDEWVADNIAQANPRYELVVSDPLAPTDEGWVYLYQSSNLPISSVNYVAWDTTLQTVTALSYTAGFTDAFVGLERLEINGNGVDVLDRQKIRVRALGGIITMNEEDLANNITPTVEIAVLGAVRGISGDGAVTVAIYGARIDFGGQFDLSGLPVSVDDMRISLDLNDPSMTGLTNYYDSNGSAFTIDGSPDAVPANPIVSWYQASGSTGGMVVAIPTINAGGGTPSTYYLDNNTPDPNDTGDAVSYADTGMFIDSPGNLVEFLLSTLILPPGNAGNVGATYAQQLANPLVATASSQNYPISTDYFLYLPIVIRE